LSTFVALLASGLAAGAIAALAAVGFLITYKATGVVNFAQGDLITLGAYVAIWVTQKEGMFGVGALDLVPGYVVTVLIMFAIGMVLERLAYAPLRGRSIHVIVITTLGAALVLRAVIGLWQGTTPKFLDSPLRGEVVGIAGANISQQRVLIIVVTAIVVSATIALFALTNFGRQLRATANDRETAKLCGVPVNWLSMLAFGLSSALAGVAGILLAPLGSVDLTLGFNFMLLGFAAAVLGGFGSIGGVVVGGLAIGLTEHLFGGYVGRDFKAMYPFILMLIVIALRPQGLFTRGSVQRL
jgi:branched-chain amino acid transport system permease protein